MRIHETDIDKIEMLKWISERNSHLSPFELAYMLDVPDLGLRLRLERASTERFTEI